MKKYLDYSCIFVKNDKINTSKLDQSIKDFLLYLEVELLNLSKPLVEQGLDRLNVVITCGYEERRDKSGKLTKSLHNSGEAIDFSLYNKDRHPVASGWTVSNWTILKSVVQSINKEYEGKGVFQVIFESTEQSDLERARKEASSDPNLIVISKTNSFYTGPHFHVQYKRQKANATSTEVFSLPEGEVDNPSSDLVSTPVCLTHLKFFYDGPNIRLFDLIKNHPVFRSYVDGSGDIIKNKVSELLSYCGTENRGVSNFDILKSLWISGPGTYVKFELDNITQTVSQDDFVAEYFSDNNILIKYGSTIMLPPETSNFLTTLALENGVRNQVSYFEDFPAFLSEKREIMESDPQYVPVTTSNGVDHLIPEFTVWIYSHKTGSILNISKFCKNVILTSPLEGFNSATINLSFLDSNTQQFQNRIVEDLKGLSLFSEYFSTQSLIWIRFESLVCEVWNQSQSTPWDLPGITEVPFSELPNKYYDFIGFVDNVYEVKNTLSSNYNVTLTAFSLDWALELDKAIFMPLAILTNDYGNGNLGFSDSNSKLMKRLSSQGEFLQLSQKILYTFEEVIKFYFGQIVQVGFIDENKSNIFESYGDRRSTLFEFYPNELRDTVKETLAKGIYQIFKVEIDTSLKGRYFSDRNIALPNGSVYSLIKNMCISPLVEVFSDTYGDTYHLVIRKPPFDYKSIKQYLDKIESDSNDFNTISSSDIYSTELKWEDKFYTWFQIVPEGATPSVGEYINLLFQIIFVNEYVETWGSRGFKFSDPYLRDIESDQLNNFSETKLQIISDLIYVLESSLYLPFTRKGRIVLNKGNRRIKKGTWIKLEPTNELFYIDKVDQKVSVSGQSVSRQTILTVSRGMVIGFIKPPQKYKKGLLLDQSYFNICSLEGLKEDLLNYINNPEKEVSPSLRDSLLISPEVFNFFMERQQLTASGGIVFLDNE